MAAFANRSCLGPDIGKTGVVEFAAPVLQKLQCPRFPQRGLAETAFPGRRQADEGIDYLFSLLHVEMQVRKHGVAGIPDHAETLAGLYHVALPDDDGALAHVAILDGPAVTLLGEDAVSAILALERPGPAKLFHIDVAHAVTHADDGSGRRRQHGDTPVHDGKITDG